VKASLKAELVKNKESLNNALKMHKLIDKSGDCSEDDLDELKGYCLEASEIEDSYVD